jgi:hypothetical protein
MEVETNDGMTAGRNENQPRKMDAKIDANQEKWNPRWTYIKRRWRP